MFFMAVFSTFRQKEILIGRGVGPQRKGADKFWMYDLEGTPNEIAQYFEEFLEDPAAGVGKKLGGFLDAKSMKAAKLFEPDYPVTVTFEYGYLHESTKEGNEKYLFKGEYGTNVITVFCPPYKTDFKDDDLKKLIGDSIPQIDITFIESLGVVYTHFDVNTIRTADEKKNLLVCRNLGRILREPALVPAILNHAVQNVKDPKDPKYPKDLLRIYVVKDEKSKPDLLRCKTRNIRFFIPEQSNQIGSYKLVYTAAPSSRAGLMYGKNPKRPSRRMPECAIETVPLLDPCIKSAAGYIIGPNTSNGFANPSPNISFNAVTGETFIAVGIDSSHLSGWNIVEPPGA
jgi:hypothetical protein